MAVIHIKLHEDLPTPAQNALRYKIELCLWRKDWRDAEARKDYNKMDDLQRSYELVGLP